jgi:hypothetical protein
VGKRFGRNQRRRAREQIALLAAERSRWQEAHARESGLLRHVSDKLRGMERQMEDLAEALGVHYVGLPACEIVMKASELQRDSFRMLTPSGAVSVMEVMRVESHHDDRSQMHVRVNLGPSTVAYAISVQALLRTPATYLARAMATELAPALLAEIRKSGYAND